MSIYVVTVRDHGVCKIGYSRQPASRFVNLQTGSFADLTLEAIVPGDMANEAQIHSKHRKSIVRGEWFKITPEIESLIMSHSVIHQTKGRGRPANNDWDETNNLTFGEELYREIKDFCLHHDVSASAFGKMAVGDWKIVSQIRQGRDLRLSTVHRIREFISKYLAEKAA